MSQENGTSPWKPVPILMYHNVLGAVQPGLSKHVYVTADEFRQQMIALKQRNYTPITFAALSDAMLRGAKLPQKPVLLTFDDGYDGLFENAHPVLTELNYSYTVFLVSSQVGNTNAWDEAIGYPSLKLLSWERINQMQVGGLAQFEAHTVNHVRLDQISLDECRREVVECRDALEQRLGCSLSVFCYPYGNHNEQVDDIVREAGFTSAVTTQFGRVRQGDSPLRLPRISIYHIPPVSLTYGIRSMNFWWRVESNRDKRPLV